ncbi:ABC-type transport auxiliary lipoprotein family protein [Maliponia aquimaris]|uniref:ABC-type transport auxiliary lipoprotein family protein n=1 Tax=Maliponia aquimaris TaxID=1673631 RepID=UPI001FE9E2DB|nr:ABC-type transport auxiliary lipoprotein family protein [Maliponia aquimaris]
MSALNSASQPLDIYELRTPSIDIRARRGTAELVVEEPVASGALSTERIMVRTGPFEAQYLPGVRWADPVPAMLQTLLVRSLGETGALGSVGRAPVGARPDFALLGELTDFQAEITEDKSAAVVRVRMMVRIVHDEESRVVASRIFEAAMPADSTETLALVAAFDRATTGLVADIVPWVLSQVR